MATPHQTVCYFISSVKLPKADEFPFLCWRFIREADELPLPHWLFMRENTRFCNPRPNSYKDGAEDSKPKWSQQSKSQIATNKKDGIFYIHLLSLPVGQVSSRDPLWLWFWCPCPCPCHAKNILTLSFSFALPMAYYRIAIPLFSTLSFVVISSWGRLSCLMTIFETHLVHWTLRLKIVQKKISCIDPWSPGLDFDSIRFDPYSCECPCSVAIRSLNRFCRTHMSLLQC